MNLICRLCEYDEPVYGYDASWRKFTGKERDGETGLDFFGARYMSAAQGRFTSADPLLNSAKPWDPQTWNRYTYALNNPLKFVDPNGLYNLINTCDDDDKKCNKQFEENARNLRRGLADLQKRVTKMKDGTDEQRLQRSITSRRLNLWREKWLVSSWCPEQAEEPSN